MKQDHDSHPSSPWIATAALTAFLGVALGAFGAHALSARVDPSLMEVYRTGVLYHLVHALAMFGCGLFLLQRDDRRLRLASAFFLGGVVLFSGSLYIMTVTGLRWLGAVTPLGGVAFLAGWVMVATSAWRPSRVPSN